MSKYNSFYELLHGDESIPHTSHFIDTFNGDQVNNWWTENDIQGTNSASIDDTIGNASGGMIVVTGTTSADRISVDFNDIRQYDPTNFIMIGIFRVDVTANFDGAFGLENNNNGDLNTAGTETICALSDSSNTNIALNSGNGTQSVVESTVPLQTDYINYRLEGFSGSSTMTMDNVLEVTKTTNLPTTRQQPFVYARTKTTSGLTSRILYMECYNK